MAVRPVSFFLAVNLVVPCDALAADNPCIFQERGQPALAAGVTSGAVGADENDVSRIVRVVGGLRLQAFAVNDLNNACAARPNGMRVIYYDPVWLGEYSGGNRWIVIGVLSHEIGHLLYEHKIDDSMTPWRREYEADYFVGQSIAELGGERDDAAAAMSKQPIDATELYPSRALRIATVIEGYDVRKSFTSVPPSTKVGPLSIGVSRGSEILAYQVEGVRFTANIADYQDGRVVTDDDITQQESSVAIRLGRDNDMMMFSAFSKAGENVCGKNLYMQIRDGDDIVVEKINAEPNWAPGEYYGITYGRTKDLFNIVGIRVEDFEFVFDPRAPRTGRSRMPVTKLLDSISAGAEGIYVEDLGCKSPNAWAWIEVALGLSQTLTGEPALSEAQKIVSAIKNGNLESLPEIENNYQKIQRKRGATGEEFSITMKDDPRRLFNIGRSILGLNGL